MSNCNNFTQATAAALLRRALWVLDGKGWPEVVMHTHDEITVMSDMARAREAGDVLMDVMLEVPDWAEGLPIAAEETQWDSYTKCLG